MNGLVIAAQMLFWAFTMVSFVLWWRAITRLTKAQKKLAKQRRPRYRVPLLVLLTLSCGLQAAQPYQPNTTAINTNADLAFFACGTVGAGIEQYVWHQAKPGTWPTKWYFQLPFEVGTAALVGGALQNNFGSDPARTVTIQHGTWTAAGAAWIWSISIPFAYGGNK